MNRRFTYSRFNPHAWVVLYIGETPARHVAFVPDPTHGGAEASAEAAHIVELLQRDHEMRASVNSAAPKKQ
jgi:hypothetical protein